MYRIEVSYRTSSLFCLFDSLLVCHCSPNLAWHCGAVSILWKSACNRSQECSRGPKTALRALQEWPRRLQEYPKRPSDGSKSAPRGFLTAPRGLEDGSKNFKEAQDGAKSVPRGLKTLHFQSSTLKIVTWINPKLETSMLELSWNLKPATLIWNLNFEHWYLKLEVCNFTFEATLLKWHLEDRNLKLDTCIFKLESWHLKLERSTSRTITGIACDVSSVVGPSTKCGVRHPAGLGAGEWGAQAIVGWQALIPPIMGGIQR